MITEERLKEIIEKSGFNVRGDEIFVYGRCDDYDIGISDEIMRLVRRVVIECAELCDINDKEQGDILRKHFGFDQ
jgi:hypothetical protein